MKVFGKFFTLITILVVTSPADSGSAKRVSHNSEADFEKGTVDGVSILAGGTLTIAPKTTRLFDPGDPFVWDIVQDSHGNTFAATGNDGRIYKISQKGSSSLFYDARELEVFSLAMDSENNLYAATFPNGKVYKIDPTGIATVFFDPEDAYIWDLVIDQGNNLYVATGQKARIYKIGADGRSTVVLKSEQKHIRSLALDKNGVLYAGSSGKGYVYKLAPAGDPYVLYDPQMEEVHNVAISADGSSIYAAAVGGPSFVPSTPKQQGQSGQSGQKIQNQSQQQIPDVSLTPQSIVPENLLLRQNQKTSLFRIDRNGYAKDLWIDREAQVLSLLYDRDDNLWIGTGKEGKVYRLNGQHQTSLLFSLDESQITNLYQSPSGAILVGTSNMGRCYSVLSSPERSGKFESEPIDAGNISQWGVLSWEGTASDQNVSLFTRSGNTEQPGETWSQWAPLDASGGIYKIKSPASRFIQWKCVFNNSNNSPQVEKVTISYLQKNLAPELTAVVIHRPGDYYTPKQNNSPKSGNKKGIVFPEPLTQNDHKKGFRSVDWLFQDPNFDGLEFDLYYKKVGNSIWKELATGLETSVYSWDSSLMEDGQYEIKVIARDNPSNPAGVALSGEKKSDPFVIDNSGPEIAFKRKKDILVVKVNDQFSTIASFYYSIDAGEYKEIYADDGINDSQAETFSIPLTGAADNETNVTLKVFDFLENVTVKHITLK